MVYWNYLVVFLCIFHSTRAECLWGCTCTGQLYDCKNLTLTAMMNETGDDVRSLDLSYNRITHTTALEGSSLLYLNLANNSIKTLQYDTFDNLDELTTLILSNNSLSRVTDDIFEWNPLKLKILKLDGNQIEFIQHFLLYDLEELTELDMHNNKITFIHPHAFLQLKKLTKIRLDGNHLHTFNSKWFSGLRANMFTQLRIDNNNWACDCAIKEQIKWLKNTKNFWFTSLLGEHALQCERPQNVTQYEVTTIPDNVISQLMCVAPDITGISAETALYVGQSIELDCKVAPLRFPTPSVVWVAPNKDRYSLQTADRFDGIEVFQTGSMIIHDFKSDDAGTYTCIATNNVSSVEATTKLSVKEGPKPSDHPTRVDESTVAADDKAYKIDYKCPHGCSCASMHVDCSLDDPTNGMTDIPLKQIPDKAITLSLASNRITRIPKFPNWSTLNELRMDNNLITSIASHAFDALGSLTTLTLRDNKISELPGKLFRNLHKLTILVLDNNELTAIEDHTFFGLDKLQWLYVRNNKITSLSGGAFHNTPLVRFIHMENNELTTIYVTTITTLTTPSKEDTSGGRVSIQKMFVDMNRFKCDCNMKEVRNFIKDNPAWDTLFGDGIRCSYPADLDGQFLTDLKDINLTCAAKTFEGIKTMGGTGVGKPCQFPFTYNGVSQRVCIPCQHEDGNPCAGKDNNGSFWCSTTTDFDTDGLFGICPPDANSNGKVSVEIPSSTSGMKAGLWFGGVILGIIICGIVFVLWGKYRHKVGLGSLKYDNLPGDDETEKRTPLTSGSEAFV